MREIKFRAWNSKEKHLMESAELKTWLSVEFNKGPGDGFVFLQYTGLKDSKGKEIYEGDIVQFTTFGSVSHRFKKDRVIRQTVEWNESGCWYPFNDIHHIDGEKGDWINDDTIEVIGNVWENAELLV